MNIPKIVKILDVKKEAEKINTILFNYPEKASPGQFFMIWIPDVDEIPMSISYIHNEIKGITFKNVGNATSALEKLKKGDQIGIRGPYGNKFNLEFEKILFVAGGTGIATITPAVEIFRKSNKKSFVIIGAKTKNEIFFKDRLEKSGAKIFISTDDGSYGFKGYATDLYQDINKKEKFDSVITCGPEIMMKTLHEQRDNLHFQASLERYIKCAIGICGQCCIGDGIRVCKEGPIFDGKTLKTIKDFGSFRRDSAGIKVRF